MSNKKLRILKSISATLLILLTQLALSAPIWTTSFGTPGSGDGQFSHSSGIALDNTGKIYVVDASRVTVWNANDNSWITSFGTPGSGDGQFSSPWGIALDNTGKIYVVDASRVTVWNANDNSWITSFGDGNLGSPDDAALDNTGKIYITDQNNRRVTVWNANDNSWITSFGTLGSGDGKFSSPFGIALDNAGKIYVVDQGNSRVTVWNANDNSWITSFGTLGSGDGKFAFPWGIALDNAGKIYVVDQNNSRVTVWNANDNSWITSFGTLGSGDGQFSSPWSITLDNAGKIYVTDTRQVSVLFDPSSWTVPSTTILGTLALNQDLELKQDYHLKITHMDDTSTGIVQRSDGKLTITDNAILTANAGSSIEATNLVLDTGTLVAKTSNIPANIIYSNNGTLAVEADITSDIDFAGNEGVLQLADGKTITGNVDSTTAPAGTLEFLGKGIVTGTIGATNPLTTLKFSGAGDSTIPAANAQTIEVANAAANVTASGILNSEVLFSADGSLVVDKGVNGSITTSADNTGTITIGAGDVGVVGAADKKLKQVNLNQGAAASIGALYAGNVDIGGIGPITATDLLTSVISFSSNGTLISNGGITGDVDFAGNEGILQLADGKTITGNVDSTTAPAGTLEFLGKGIVTGTIGATNPLTTLKFSGAGDSTIPAANAQTIEVANAAANVTASGILNSEVLFSADGSLVADKGVNGSITTSADNTGTITIGAGDVGVVGAADKKLKQVNLNQGAAASIGALYAGNVDIGGIGPITATDLLTSVISFSSNGTLISNGGITGDVDFAGNEGILQLADGKTITGNVDSTTASAGTLEFLGKGIVTGTIGATNPLTTLKFSGAGDSTIPAANAQTIEVANAAANVTASGILNSEVLFSADGSLVADKGVNGSITTSADNTGTITIGAGDVGVVGAADKKLKQVNLNQGAAASIGALYAGNVDIGGIGPITATDLLTSVISFSSDGTLISNAGITGKVDFAGNEGILQLADGKTITGNVDSTTAPAGTLEFLGKGIVTGTIGATNPLTTLKFSGAGDSTIPAANAQTIEVANAAANVTASGILNSEVLFSADGSLVADKGVNGSITTSADNTGTITIGAGDVGVVGAADKKLKQVNLNQGAAASIGALYAGNVDIGGIGPITATDLLTSVISFSSDGTLISNAGITGDVDFAGNEGILQLADGKTITGNVDSTTAPAGTLEFLGKGIVTGTIGATNPLTTLKFSGAGDSTIPAANAQTIEVANAAANVTASGILNSEVLFSADGSLVADKGVNGSITTSADNTGTITIGAGDVGVVGAADKKLKQVNLNQGAAASIGALYAGNVDIGGIGPITATDLLTSVISFSSNGTLISNGGITGDVDFAGNEGILQLADGKTITGNVDSTTASAGTLEFLGKGIVTGTIGATNPLTTLKFSGAGDSTIPAANAQTIEVANAAANVTASGILNSEVLFSADGSLVADKGVNGSITTSADNTGTITIGAGDVGVVGAADKKLKQVNLNQGAAASIGALYAGNVDIGGIGPITATDLLTSVISFSSNGTLISNGGITGDVDFAGNEGILQLADGKTITGNVDSTTASAGTLEFLGKGIVTGTIGATNPLTTLKFSGAGDSTIPAANAQTIEVANAAANVTASGILNSEVLFSADGSLVADKGVNGSITTSADNTGTITIGAGDVGVVGAADKKLKQVNLNQGAAASIGALYAGNVDIGGIGPITATDLLTSVISFSSDGTLISNAGITGKVDFAGNEGILQLADGKTITGNVDSTTAPAGTLEFLGKGIVTGTIGATNPLTTLKFSGAGDSTIPAANAQTIEVANAAANVTASGILNSEVLFSADGSLVADKGVNGSITTSADNTGTITIGAGDVGVVGAADKKLKQVNLNQGAAASIGALYAGNVDIGGIGPITATDLLTSVISFSSNGTLISNAGITGKVDFAGNEGILQLADGKTITGNVDSTTASAGTLEFLGKGIVTGTIGATNPLTTLKFSGAGDSTIPAANAQTIEVANAAANVTASGILNSEVLFSADGSLVADKGVNGSITTSADNTGTITIGAGDVGVVGAADKKLKQVNLNQGAAASIGALYAGNVDIGGIGPITATDLLTSVISFSSDGTLISNAGITGDVDFAGNEGILQLADGKTITGNVDSTTAPAGTLEFLGKGIVTGTIGATNPLTTLKFSGAGDSTIPAANAQTIEVANAAANVTASGILNSEVLFSADGSLVADKGVNGSITTSADNTGTITIGAGDVGVVGAADKKLKQVNLNQGAAASVGALYAGNVDIGGIGPITATDLLTSVISFSSNGTLISNGGITGDVDFAGNEGILQLADGKTITGNVDSTTAPAGTLEFLGKGIVTGTIGATNPLTTLKFSGAGDSTIPAANAQTIEVANAAANVTASGILNSEVLFSADGSLVADKGVNGSITTSADNTGTITIGAGDVGVVGAADKKLKQVNLNQGAAASIGALYAGNVDIGGIGPITATDLLTSVISFSSDGTLISNAGITGDVDFAGNEGILQLADGKTITGNVDSTTAPAGTLEFLGKGIVTGTIGATNPLTTLKFSGAGDSTIPAANAQTIEVANAAANVTASGILNSEVLFSADGSLVADKGVNGSITTSADNTGTITIGAGDVGVVGAADKKLKQVNLNQGAAASVGALYAGNVDIGGIGPITATDLLTSVISFSSNGTLISNGGITGDVDFAGNEGILQLADGKTITGNVDSTTAPAGTLEFLGKGIVTGTIGATNPLTTLKFSGAGDSTIPAANAQTIEVANAAANVTASGILNSEVLFSADGSLVADKGVNGSITTSADNTGTITIGAGDVGVVGAADKKLKQVNLNQGAAASVGALYAGNVDIGGIGPITATDLLTSVISFSSNGTLISNGGITGDVDFAGNEGILQLADGKTITGNVDSTTAPAGTLEFLGKGIVTGTIGATNPLTTLKFSGAGDSTIPAANAQTIEVANAAANVTASGILNSEVLFSADGSLVADKGVNGSITTSADNTGTITIGAGDVGVVGAADKKLKQVNLNQGAAASIGALYAGNVDIGGIGPITATDLLTSVISFSSDGTLISNAGITGDVDFAGNEGILQLADGKTITGNVDSTTAPAGTLEFLGKGIVTGTIGATNPLTTLKFSGAGDSTIPAANAQTIEVANAAANVTASGILNSEVLFSADGSLVADKGVNGSITTSADNTGTITIGAGDVGVVGAADKKLKQVNLNQGAAASIGALYAGNVDIGGIGPITATDLLTSVISFSSNGTLISNGGITGDVDFAGNEGILQLADGKTITGNVDSTTAPAGTLEFLGKGIVTGTIGATNPLTTLKFSGAGDSTIPAANAQTIEVANAAANVTASGILNSEVLFSADGSLVADKGVNGSITTSADNTGTITIGAGDVGVVGAADKKLKQVNLNQGAAASIGALYAGNVDIGGIGPITATDLLTSVISFSSNGTLISNGGITGDVDFAGNEGILQLADGKTITGNVDSTTASAGTLEFLGKGIVTGTIGATNPLTTLKFSGAGDSTIPAANAQTIEVANAAANVTASGILNSEVLFSADGSLVADKGVNGSITTSADNTGTITIGAGDVGVVGAADKKLKQVNLNQGAAASIGALYAGNVDIGGIGPITATDLLTSVISFSSDGTLISNAGITGKVDFAGNEGILQLADGKTITGNVDSTTAPAGTLEFLGKGIVTGTIGATNPLTTLKFSGAGDSTIPAANAQTIEVANAAANVTASGILNSEVLFSADGSLVADKGVNGSITTSADNTGTITIGAGDVGVVGAADKKLKQVNLNQGAAASIGALYAGNVDIGGIGPITATDLLTSVISFSSNGTLISNAGITGKVDFAGNEGILQLADGKTITGNVDSTTASAGTLEFLGKGIVTGTIGATNPLTTLKFSGAGDSTIPAANAQTIEVANAAANVTASGILNSEVLFSADGSLVADKGVNGSITTSADNTGTITIGAGDVGVVGAADKKLKQVNLNQGAAASIGALYAGNVDIGGIGPITATDLLTSVISFSSDGTLISNAGITGDVDFAGNEGILQLADGKTITGNVDSTTAPAGTLEFLGKGIVTGTIGATNPLTTLKFSGAGDSTIPAANAQTIEVANAAANVTASGILNSEVLFSADGSLVADKGVNGSITTSADNTGTITIGAGDVGVVGAADKKLKQVNLNQGAAASIGALYAGNVDIGGIGPITATDLLTSVISFSSNGTLISNGGITGDVDFAGNEGILQLADGKTITGNVDSTTASAGTLEFLGKGIVTGTIGATNPLTTLKFSGAGDSTIPAANAQTIEVANAAANVTASGILNSEVLFSADGSLVADKGVNGSITTSADNTGTITIGAGDVGVVGAADKKLKQVNLNQGAAASIGALYAGNVDIGGIGPITATDLLTSVISFSSNGTLISNGGITGDVDFAGNEGILQLADGKTITGNVDSTTASAGTLEFLGKGIVTGTIGATNPLTTLKFSGAGDSTIPAANAQTIEVANAAANVTASGILNSEVLFSADGSLVADKGIIGNVTFNDAGTLVATGISGAIDCNSQAATINFDGNKEYILSSPIQNAENATLDVNLPKLTMIDLEVGGINISDNKILAIDLASGNKTLLAPGGNGIKFLGANSTFQIENTSNNDARVATFTANLAGDTGGGGILLLSGGLKGLSITGDNAPTTIGVPGNEIAIVETQGIVTMQDSMDASSVSQLNIVSGSNFTDQSCSTVNIPNINIGTTAPTAYLQRLDDVEVFSDLSSSKAQLTLAGAVRVAPPSAIYTVDVSSITDQNLDILGPGQNINFIDANATLKLSNAGSSDHSITLLRDLDSGKDDFARVELSSSAGSTLTVKGGLLGTDTHKLKQLELSGDGLLIIESSIHTANLELNVPVITLADVYSNLSFATNTMLTATGNIYGNIDLQNNAAVINMADGMEITGNVNSTGGNSGTINFEGKGAVDGIVTNLTILKAGAGDVTFKTSGDYSITELQGNGSGTITFPSNMKYVGGMNITGGQPVNLNLANNTIINGNIGSSTSPVGNISSHDNTEFNEDINSNRDIKTLGKTLFAGNVACNNILANTNSSDALSSFSLFAPATTNVRNTINFDQDNVITKFQGTVHTKGGIKASGSTYFADTVNSQGNITINGDTKFNKTLSSGNNIDISHGSNVIFNGDVSSRSININSSNIQVSDNISIAGNISASNSTIILDNKMLTLSGINIFTNQIMINTTYDEFSLSGGNIILAPGSTLDLSNVSELIVKLSFTNSDISKIADNTIYNIILAEDGSNIVPLNDPEHQIILDSSGEQNKFVKWKLDASSLTLYAYDDSNDVIDTDYVFDSVQDNMFMQELKHVTPNSNAAEFKNNIGLLDKEQAEEMFARILDHAKERDSAIVQVALHQTLTDTNKVAMNAIHNRLSNTGSVSQAAIAAGDDNAFRCNDNIYEDGYRYGMWARSSINHSKDKVSGKNAEYFSSYKTKGHSNTIGFDSLICDNILLGIAYTNAYTSIRPKDQNIGNIDKVRTNMFSLYSAYNIPNYNWYLNSTISYAESAIRSGKTRYLAIAKNVLDSEVAFGKYKSHLYSGSVSLGYNHSLGNNAYVTPSLGVIGSLIRDKGYTETGTSFQNLTVRKKNYNKLSSIAGLRVYQDIYFRHMYNVGNASSLVVTPEAYGFVNYNIKNKSPATDARIQGIDERLPTINYRSNKVDYNLGLGITIKQNMMEYGINYDANLAKKYQGHTGSIKVRVNL